MFYGFGSPEALESWARASMNLDPTYCFVCNKVAEAKVRGQVSRFIMGHGGKYSRNTWIMASDHDEAIDLRDSKTQTDIAKAIEEGIVLGIVPGVRSITHRRDGSRKETLWWYYEGLDKTGRSTTNHFSKNVGVGLNYEFLPKDLSVLLSNEADKVVRWFHPKEFPDFDYEAVPTKRAITDEDAARRIKGFQYAMDKEIARILAHNYHHADGDWDVWNWGHGSEWEEYHDAWIEDFNQWKDTGEGRMKLESTNVNRYDLSRLPWELQRALVTHWEAIWEKYEGKYHPELGFLYDDLENLDVYKTVVNMTTLWVVMNKEASNGVG